jgi:hypothetical protein
MSSDNFGAEHTYKGCCLSLAYRNVYSLQVTYGHVPMYGTQYVMQFKFNL